jgi:hypothetical protein
VEREQMAAWPSACAVSSFTSQNGRKIDHIHRKLIHNSEATASFQKGFLSQPDGSAEAARF